MIIPCSVRFFLSIQLATFLSLQAAHAGSAAWNLSPANGNWSMVSNWSPATVPDSTTDTASFAMSNTTAVSLSASIQVATIVFNAGASPYIITTPAGKTLTLSGSGITNNSGITQELVAAGGGATGGTINFVNGASPHAMTKISLLSTAAERIPGGKVEFFNFSDAGSATFDLAGSPPGAFNTVVFFHDISFAGTATFILHAGTDRRGSPGEVSFFDNAFAGSATIICEGAAFPDTAGAFVLFGGSTNASNSTITVNGGQVPGALTGVIDFSASASAGLATLTANGGVGQGGGIRFSGNATGGSSKILLVGNGYLDISQETLSNVTIGSIEGDGPALLGAGSLSVGSNSLDTTYSGILQDGGIGGGTGGSFIKLGTGTLTLAGASSYTGSTTVNSGALTVANGTGSATGTGPVQVNAGRIGGSGTIAGPLTVGANNGSAATLQPGPASRRSTTLTIANSLLLNADAIYSYGLNSARGTSSNVAANGVTTNGARILARDTGSAVLAPGTVLTAINNTSATPINGTFRNLADGSTITVRSNTFLVSYEGGDGNNLTLTVQ